MSSMQSTQRNISSETNVPILNKSSSSLLDYSVLVSFKKIKVLSTALGRTETTKIMYQC